MIALAAFAPSIALAAESTRTDIPLSKRKPTATLSAPEADYSAWTADQFRDALAELHANRNRTSARTFELTQRLAEAGASETLSTLHLNSLRAALAQASVKLTELNRKIERLHSFTRNEQPELAEELSGRRPVLDFMFAVVAQRDELQALGEQLGRRLTAQQDQTARHRKERDAARDDVIQAAIALQAERDRYEQAERIGMQLAQTLQQTTAEKQLAERTIEEMTAAAVSDRRARAQLEQQIADADAATARLVTELQATQNQVLLAQTHARDLSTVVKTQTDDLTGQRAQLAQLRAVLEKTQDGSLALERRVVRAQKVISTSMESRRNLATRLEGTQAMLTQERDRLVAVSQRNAKMEQDLLDAAAQLAERDQALVSAKMASAQRDLDLEQRLNELVALSNEREQLQAEMQGLIAEAQALDAREAQAQQSLERQAVELRRLNDVERQFNAQSEALAASRDKIIELRAQTARMNKLEEQLLQLETALLVASQERKRSGLLTQALVARERQLTSEGNARATLQRVNDELRAQIADLQARNPTVIELAFQGSNGLNDLSPHLLPLTGLMPVGSRQFLDR